jgi:hypothetical protein
MLNSNKQFGMGLVFGNWEAVKLTHLGLGSLCTKIPDYGFVPSLTVSVKYHTFSMVSHFQFQASTSELATLTLLWLQTMKMPSLFYLLSHEILV